MCLKMINLQQTQEILNVCEDIKEDVEEGSRCKLVFAHECENTFN